MTKKITSDALESLNKSLGLTGSSAVAGTELMDSRVFQTVDILPVVRRSRTLSGSQGIFSGAFRNEHTDAQSLVTSVNPYDIASSNTIAPYPTLIKPQFDLWLLAASVVRNTGGGTFTGTLEIAPNSAGWGESDDGSPAAFASLIVASWKEVVTRGGTTVCLIDGGNTLARIGLRLPRIGGVGQLVKFRSTSSLTSTYTCILQIGMFPVGFGQDGMT